MADIIDISTVKRINENAGYYFFSPDTMRFFKSKASKIALLHNNNYYFVTSEQFDYKSPRLYTLRCMNKGGNVLTINGFQNYNSNHTVWHDINKIIRSV